MKKTSLSIFALAIALTFTACKPSDEKITAEVQKVVSSEPGMAPVSYTVQDGVLTLSGEVESEELKTSAEQKLKDVKGIKSVVNNITVKPAIILPTPEDLKAQADNALKGSVDAALTATGVQGISAEVADSIVTLKGDVKKADLMKVMQAAMSVTPKKVDNQLNIIKK